MSDEQRNTVWRFAIIFIFILIGFFAVLGKIIYVQTMERDEWLKVAEKQVPTVRPIAATRGNILDCNGRLLASSMPQYYVYMDTRVPALHDKGGELFQKHIKYPRCTRRTVRCSMPISIRWPRIWRRS